MTAVSLPDGTRWVRCRITDVFGEVRSVSVPATQWADALALGVGFDGSALEGPARSSERELLLVPDTSTLVRWAPGEAAVVCTAEVHGRADPLDGRSVLRRLVEDLGELADAWEAVAELEVYVLGPDGRPVDDLGYHGDGGVAIGVATAAADRLGSLGVAVASCHHEAGPGQVELDLAALGPVALADALVLARLVLVEEAAARGLSVSFDARPWSEQPGSGLHLHQRARDRLADERGDLDEDGRSFVAGQLAHARGLCAIAAPTVSSYRRLHAGPEAPTEAVWAHHHRSALVRVSPLLGGGVAIEHRLADASANPHLLVAALLAAGADGLEQQLEPPPPLEEAGGFDPAKRVDGAAPAAARPGQRAGRPRGRRRPRRRARRRARALPRRRPPRRGGEGPRRRVITSATRCVTHP